MEEPGGPQICPSLSSLSSLSSLFIQAGGITAKKAAKPAVRGLANSSRGIRAENFTSTQPRTPVAPSETDSTTRPHVISQPFHQRVRGLSELFGWYLQAEDGRSRVAERRSELCRSFRDKVNKRFQPRIQRRSVEFDLLTREEENFCCLLKCSDAALVII